MKKTYKKPVAEIIEVQLNQMIALSTLGGDADQSGEVLAPESDIFDLDEDF